MADPKGFEIRKMRLDDLEIAVDWAAAEGWNPGLSDAKVFHAFDPDGFWIGELQGKPIASVSAVTYASGVAFAGFFIVLPQYRGQGYGRRMAAHAMELMGPRTVGLDGVVAQQDNYKSAGFDYAYASYRFQAMGGGEAPSGLILLEQAPWSQVLELDTACFFSERAAFVRNWISQPGVFSLAMLEGSHLQGFGVLRPCRAGYKMGPLFARSPKAAELIYLGLLAKAPGQEVYLDVPANNPQAMELARSHKLEEVFETARMYRNGEPKFRHEWVYGVTSFELG